MHAERWPGEPLHDRLTPAEREELAVFLFWHYVRRVARQQWRRVQ